MLALFRRVVVGHQRELASCKRILDDRPEGIDHGENGGAAGATDQKEAQGIAETPQDHGTVRAGPPDERRVDQHSQNGRDLAEAHHIADALGGDAGGGLDVGGKGPIQVLGQSRQAGGRKQKGKQHRFLSS